MNKWFSTCIAHKIIQFLFLEPLIRETNFEGHELHLAIVYTNILMNLYCIHIVDSVELCKLITSVFFHAKREYRTFCNYVWHMECY